MAPEVMAAPAASGAAPRPPQWRTATSRA